MYGRFIESDGVDRTRFGIEIADRILLRILDGYFPAVAFPVDRQDIRRVAAGRYGQAVGTMNGFDMIAPYIEREFLPVAGEVGGMLQLIALPVGVQ